MLCTDFCCKLNNTKSVALSKTAQFVIPITSMVKHGIFACYNDSSTSLCYFNAFQKKIFIYGKIELIPFPWLQTQEQIKEHLCSIKRIQFFMKIIWKVLFTLLLGKYWVEYCFQYVLLCKIKLKFVLEHSHSLVWLYLLRVVVKPISKHFL